MKTCQLLVLLALLVAWPRWTPAAQAQIVVVTSSGNPEDMGKAACNSILRAVNAGKITIQQIPPPALELCMKLLSGAPAAPAALQAAPGGASLGGFNPPTTALSFGGTPPHPANIIGPQGVPIVGPGGFVQPGGPIPLYPSVPGLVNLSQIQGPKPPVTGAIPSNVPGLPAGTPLFGGYIAEGAVIQGGTPVLLRTAGATAAR